LNCPFLCNFKRGYAIVHQIIFLVLDLLRIVAKELSIQEKLGLLAKVEVIEYLTFRSALPAHINLQYSILIQKMILEILQIMVHFLFLEISSLLFAF